MLVAALAICFGPGCVRRRLTIRSNPPGALVYVDNQAIGTTPCSVDFIYYGTREIRLVKDGFETLTVNQPIPTPWYEVPPLDFVSDVLNPSKTRDDRAFSYQLQPRLIVPPDQLLARAEQLRQSAQQGTPVPVIPGSGVPVGLPPIPGARTLPPGGEPIGPGVDGGQPFPVPAPGQFDAQHLPPAGSAPVFVPPRISPP